jgi:glucokinase
MNLFIADIGGTNSRCAVGAESGVISNLTTFRNADFPDLQALLTGYLVSLPGTARPSAGALAIAAPIRGDGVQMINIAWRFSRPELQRQLGLTELHLLNDFAALAWALPALAATDVLQVGGGAPAADGLKVVLGPGTGLGVASLVRVEGRWQAIPGEGGHVTLAAQDEQEEMIIRRARERFGHCSAERLLSGSGLSFLHLALHGGDELTPAEIGRRLVAGDEPAARTFELFFRLLGTVAGNAALTVGAYGGVYIGGGIVPRYLEALRRSGFRERFEAKGRYRDYLRAIPTWAIISPYPVLTGLLAFAEARRVV